MAESVLLDIGEFFTLGDGGIMDQLTQVRNYVRNQFVSHDGVDEIQVTVVWRNGDVEVMVFDRWVGFPKASTPDEWFERWTFDAGVK